MTDSERRALRGRVADAVRDIAWYGTEPPAAFDDQRAGLHRKVASALAVTGLTDRRGFPGIRVRCALACAEARASIAEAGRLHDMAGDVPDDPADAALAGVEAFVREHGEGAPMTDLTAEDRAALLAASMACAHAQAAVWRAYSKLRDVEGRCGKCAKDHEGNYLT